MASFAATAALAAHTVALPTTLALSGVFGSISMVAWICVLLPQLFANFKAQSADGLSMVFLIVWLLGDLTNLLGALFTNLAPTAIALPSYFCLADLVLICQCAYYNTLNDRRKRAAKDAPPADEEPAEDSPLLQRRRSSLGLPGSHRRPDTHTETAAEPLTKAITGEDDTQDSNPWLHNSLSLVGVWVVGVVAWYISYEAGAWDGKEAAPGAPDEARSPLEISGLVLGYVSAVCYLCARVPQIIKNYREQSCEGLALLFFMLSLTGNLTYGVSVIAYSQEKRYMLNALPFLIGSLGTIIEDSIIFVQFRLYSGNTKVVTPE